MWWRRGAVGGVSDLQSRGRGFESRPGTRSENSAQVSHTYVPLSPSNSIVGTHPIRAVMPCGWGVKAGMVRMWVAGDPFVTHEP